MAELGAFILSNRAFILSNIDNDISPLTKEEFSDFAEWVITSSNLLPLTVEKLAAIQHQSAWTDVAAKAKRLVQDGQVTILRNAPHHVMAHVVGDHGEYNCEISRHDPQSQIIEQWNCECPWAQYSFDRTRKWKKLEGRVCSHVLATYWKAKSTPMDMSEQESGMVAPPGQKVAPQSPIPGLEAAPPPMMPDTEQRQFSPDEQNEQSKIPPVGPPTNKDITFGLQPVVTQPKPQYEQMSLFDITAPPGQQPIPGAMPVSVPGGAPPSPGNPVQFPGTFSHFIPTITIHTSNFIYSADELTTYCQQQRALGMPTYVKLKKLVALELKGGKIPMPGAQPYDTSVEGVPLYNVMQLGWNPQTQRRENADFNEVSGAPEQQGVYVDVVPGKRAEVLDFDPNMKFAYISVPLNYPGGEDVRLHPHSAVGWVEYADVVPDQGRNPYRLTK